tara:strand:+ start:962 stop:1474 length:513 start_codon:yes stop_codon:yes gene_type:complete
MKNIYTKLAAVKKEIGAISKDSTNPFFKSKYFDINGLLKHVEPLLDKNGLLLLQPIVDGLVYSQIIDIETGDKVESSLSLPQISDPQKIGSCVSYYRRYTLQSLICLQSIDDDANIASKATKASPSPKEKAWVNKQDNVWNRAVDKGVKIDELLKHYSLSKENQALYPYR